ncbi:core histone macro-H2A.1-like [Dermacentor silvarum]|uniref:core histone macro-H2A.1-like n=1 Tax=Dermacentor silvarum TaxID=543639 RepID=UPI00189ACE98|nr:core histone macro-H2A.1-like [Dermacentor silvarum]
MSSRGGKKRSKAVSKSTKAGVLFPVGRIGRYLRKSTHHFRIGAGAPVYMAAVIEYLTAEILELAGNAARDNKKNRVTPRHILLAIANDDELHQLLRGVTIASGGVLPRIQPELLVRKKGNKFVMPSPKHQPSAHMRVDNPPSKLHQAATASVAAAKPMSAPPPPKKIAATAASKKQLPPPPSSLIKEKGKGTKGKDSTGGEQLHSSVTVLSEKKLFLGQKLTVIQGDMASVIVDAAIHPTNANFSLAGEVGQVLEKAGGKEFQQEVRELLASHGPLETAGVAICPGHHFPAKHVIHCHVPTGANAMEHLEKCVRNCLVMADDKNIRVLAIPPLVSHNTSPSQKQLAAQSVLRAISSYFVNIMGSSLKQVYFVLSDMESIGIYTSELAKLDS